MPSSVFGLKSRVDTPGNLYLELTPHTLTVEADDYC